MLVKYYAPSNQMTFIYSVSKKNPLCSFLTVFRKRLGDRPRQNKQTLKYLVDELSTVPTLLLRVSNCWADEKTALG